MALRTIIELPMYGFSDDLPDFCGATVTLARGRCPRALLLYRIHIGQSDGFFERFFP